MKRLSLILLPCLLVVVLAGLFLHPTSAHGTAASPTTCGKGWPVVKSPNPYGDGPLENDLYNVAAISANDVWAVGYALVPNHNLDTYGIIEHWNGTSWSVIPDASPQYAKLTGVAAVATNDVWVVGQVDYPSYKPFIEHWNGTAWSKVANPAPKYNALSAVVALSSTDVWAVGGISEYYTPQTLIEHWNGTAWSVVPNPSPKKSYLNAVTAVSANDIWAVGGENVSESIGSTEQPFIEHWNGTNWTVIASPPPVMPGAVLTGVAAVSATDVWAVGGNPYSGSLSLIEHWDGTQWTIVQIPPQGILSAVSAVSANNVWAVGGHGNTLILHWNGTAWHAVSNRLPGALYGVTLVPGTTQLWAVGERPGGKGADRTLTRFYC